MVNGSPFTVRVHGRPAPQGSKRLGEHGQLLEQSPYLAAWRGKWVGAGARRRYSHGVVGRAVYERYASLGIEPAALPLFGGSPVEVCLTFYVDTDPAAPPDLDKLTRATLDALTVCRVFHDDSVVVRAGLSKESASAEQPAGVFIMVTPTSALPRSGLIGNWQARRRAHRLSRRWGGKGRTA